MKAAIFVSGSWRCWRSAKPMEQPEGQTISGFQCVGINIPGLHLTAGRPEDRRKVPLRFWMREGMAQ